MVLDIVGHALCRSETKVWVELIISYSTASFFFYMYVSLYMLTGTMSPNTVLCYTGLHTEKYQQQRAETVDSNCFFPCFSIMHLFFFNAPLSLPPQLWKWRPKQIWANWKGNKALLRKILRRSEEQWGEKTDERGGRCILRRSRRQRESLRNLHNAKRSPGEAEGTTCSRVLFP